MFNFFANVNYSDTITFKQWRTIKKWAKRPYNLGLKHLRYSRFCLNGLQSYIKDLKWIFISYGIYETSFVFYIPEPLAKGYKTHNKCHKYRMKWKFITDSFYHMFNPQKREKNRGFFFTDFTAKNATTSGRYLWCHRRTATFQPIKMLPGAMS